MTTATQPHHNRPDPSQLLPCFMVLGQGVEVLKQSDRSAKAGNFCIHHKIESRSSESTLLLQGETGKKQLGDKLIDSATDMAG